MDEVKCLGCGEVLFDADPGDPGFIRYVLASESGDRAVRCSSCRGLNITREDPRVKRAAGIEVVSFEPGDKD